MKHIVTLSLVFFSLTHLAKAEQRVEGLRLLTERYCNKTQANTEELILSASSQDDHQSPFFLTYGELTLIGILPSVKIPAQKICNHTIADLAIRKNAKNNSP